MKRTLLGRDLHVVLGHGRGLLGARGGGPARGPRPRAGSDGGRPAGRAWRSTSVRLRPVSSRVAARSAARCSVGASTAAPCGGSARLGRGGFRRLRRGPGHGRGLRRGGSCRRKAVGGVGDATGAPPLPRSMRAPRAAPRPPLTDGDSHRAEPEDDDHQLRDAADARQRGDEHDHEGTAGEERELLPAVLRPVARDQPGEGQPHDDVDEERCRDDQGEGRYQRSMSPSQTAIAPSDSRAAAESAMPSRIMSRMTAMNWMM